MVRCAYVLVTSAVDKSIKSLLGLAGWNATFDFGRTAETSLSTGGVHHEQDEVGEVVFGATRAWLGRLVMCVCVCVGGGGGWGKGATVCKRDWHCVC